MNKTAQALFADYKNAPDAGARAVVFGQLKEHTVEELQRRQSPRGGLPGINALLDERRFTYLISDAAFAVQASFDTCFVHQVGRFVRETYGDTGIFMPDTAKRRVNEESPRGILVGAGLQALDSLRSNGIDLGHMVSLIRQAPWRMPVDMVAGTEMYLLILRAGDITGSEDTRDALASGKCKIVFDKDARQHIYVDETGQPWTPTLPFRPDDY